MFRVYGKLRFHVLVIAVCCLVSVACASRFPNYRVTVDAMARTIQQPMRTFRLCPGKSQQTGLQYEEFARYATEVLTACGYSSVAASDDADFVVELTVEISEPQMHQSTTSIPLMGQTGIGSSTFSGAVSGSSVSGTAVHSPTYGIIGSVSRTDRFPVFLRKVSMRALASDRTPLWEVNSSSFGESSDLRRVTPYLMVALQPYIAKQTQHQVRVSIPEDDPAVTQLRGGELESYVGIWNP